MISLEALEALDYLLWLRTGNGASEALRKSQSSISRQSRETLIAFGLKIHRQEGEWQLKGPKDLLQLERELHQLYRFQRGGPLRLEAPYWWQRALDPAPEGWCTGVFDHVGIQRPQELLRQRIVDAWLYAAPDLPPSDDRDLQVFRLSAMPLYLVAAPDHPLAGEHNLSPQDVARFPTLALPSGAIPQSEQQLRQLGLWTTPMRMRCYDEASWEGKCSDGLTITYGNGLSMQLQPQLSCLDLPLDFPTGDALVVHRDVASFGAIELLLLELRKRLAAVALAQPSFELLSC
ncbi:MAG: LysR substrate-binding domain-containing protein [Synechococcus lacustris]